MEYYSAIKRDEVVTHVTTQMSLENIMLSEISQIKSPYFHTDRKQISGCQELGGRVGTWAVTVNGYGVSLWGNENDLELDSDDS